MKISPYSSIYLSIPVSHYVSPYFSLYLSIPLSHNLSISPYISPYIYMTTSSYIFLYLSHTCMSLSLPISLYISPYLYLTFAHYLTLYLILVQGRDPQIWHPTEVKPTSEIPEQRVCSHSGGIQIDNYQSRWVTSRTNFENQIDEEHNIGQTLPSSLQST